MLKRIMLAALMLPVTGGASCDALGFVSMASAENPSDASKRPHTMNGSEYSSIRRRPMRSMRTRAMPVKMKLVTATLRDASVGLLNPTSVNIVAEKYMSEFYDG